MDNTKLEKVESDVEQRVWSIDAFAKRHRLDDEEKLRLTCLLGVVATESELLRNARRNPRWRH
ncbi:hypothetical protein QO002_001191 [Pararhizobium capsulatum DSM 1112]|uniref:Uncharacterized protein n=1 Tax=Pararhizobium capsulatum DSM 1112 TaxID=1121113 RepID=A0ABU0BLD5_9HYPH|nr:hypothetical protein [Pararhizobium capsulatum]MDQ0319053.1 hypothetical protein [Pararhizobium capsulatum DSM 1112]